jgi:3-oxoacyl-(acyl-carrier-protein) synthase
VGRITRPDNQRVVVTGMGVATVLGQTPGDLFDSLVAGRSGIARWKGKGEGVYSQIGGDMSGFDAVAHLQRSGASAKLIAKASELLRISPRACHLAVAVSTQAFLNARFGEASERLQRVGHVLAGHNINSDFQLATAKEFFEEPEFIDPMYGLVAFDTDPAAVTSELLELRGPLFTVGGACASGNVAVMTAVDNIRVGRVDAMRVTAISTMLSPLILQGWSILDALSIKSFNEEPSRASRPFDRRREGFVPSEGSGSVVLESLASARRRGARIHAEIVGCAATSSAVRHTRPAVAAQRDAMAGALDDAGVSPADVNYVNAHGTSTPIGDRNEIAALRQVLGEHVTQIPINATKSMMGHALQASSLIELIATILQTQRRTLHPTINLEEPDSEFVDLDLVAKSRPHDIRVALSNAFGFGGINAVVAVAPAP